MKTSITAGVLAALAVIITGVVLCSISSRYMDDMVTSSIQERLMDQANSWRIIADSYEKNIQSREESARIEAQEIVISQTKMVYEIIDKALARNTETLSPDGLEDLLDRLSRHTVGRTGYISLVDYQGNYILSGDRERDGENLWDITYDGEIYPSREIIAIGRELRGSQVGFFEYQWANHNDPGPRDKIAAIMHFPQKNWILTVTTYYDDFVTSDYRRKTIEELIDLIAQQEVGHSGGYIAVLDSDGHYVVSLNRLRDGENISQLQDASGRYFVQDGIKMAHAAGADADILRYPWLTPGAAQARDKIGAVAYYETWDWIIWPNVYLDDFDTNSTLSHWMIFVIIIAALIAGFAGFEFTYRTRK